MSDEEEETITDTEIDTDDTIVTLEVAPPTPLREGDVVYIKNFLNQKGIIIKIERNNCRIDLSSTNTFDSTKQSRVTIYVSTSNLSTPVEKHRQDQSLLQSTPSVTKHQQRKRHDLLGIKYCPLQFCLIEPAPYQWTGPSLTVWPHLRNDSRVWKVTTSLSHGERLLALFFERAVQQFSSSSTISSNINQSIDSNRSSDSKTPDIVIQAPSSREAITRCLIEYLIGNERDIVSEMMSCNEDDSAYDRILVSFKSSLETVRSLSICCVTIRGRIEGCIMLWQNIYYICTTVNFPTGYMNQCYGQHSPKSQVLSRIMCSPTCECGSPCDLIHAITLQILCTKCFNKKQLSGDLDLVNKSEAKTIPSRCGNGMNVISNYSGKNVTVYLSKLLMSSCQSQTTHNSAVQPIEMLENISCPGKNISKRFSTSNDGVITGVVVGNVKGYEVLALPTRVRSVFKQYKQEQSDKDRQRLQALLKLAKNKRPIEEKEEARGGKKKRKKQKKRKERNRKENFTNALFTLNNGLLYTVGSVVNVVTDNRTTRSMVEGGVIVRFVQERAPAEYYEVAFTVKDENGDGDSCTLSKKRMVISREDMVIDELQTNKRRRLMIIQARLA